MKDSDLFANEMAELHKEVGRFVLELLETNRGGVADSLVQDISSRMAGKLQAELWQGDRQLFQAVLEELKRVRELPPIAAVAQGGILNAATTSSQPQSGSPPPVGQTGEIGIRNRGQSGGLSPREREVAGESNPDRDDLFGRWRIPRWAMIAAAVGFVAVMLVSLWLLLSPLFSGRPNAEDKTGETSAADYAVDPAEAAAGQWQRILNTVEGLPEAERVAAYRTLCGAPDAATCQYEARRAALAEDQNALRLAARLRVLADCADPRTGGPLALSLTCIVGPDQ